MLFVFYIDTYIYNIAMQNMFSKQYIYKKYNISFSFFYPNSDPFNVSFI